jgi:CO/xanthine dehydrogenase Mo-binding subunit
VIAVLSAADLPVRSRHSPLHPLPNLRPYSPRHRARCARHAREAVAVVLADDRYRAADAASR